MIKSIYVKNFKALKEINLELSNLNVLTGLNGMGKSSLIQALLMLRQSFFYHEGKINSIRLNGVNGKYCNIGVGSDALYQSAKEDNIRIKVGFDDSCLPVEDSYIDLNLRVEHEQEYLTHIEDFISIIAFKNLSIFNDNFNYLNVEHIGPLDLYPKNDEVRYLKSIGIKGENVVHFLSYYGEKEINLKKLKHTNSKSLLLSRQVDSWLNEIVPGTKVEYMEVPGQDLFLLKFKFETSGEITKSFKPKNVGFGLNYILPTITTLLSANKDSLIILENPESHLHPKGQSKIGELIALVAQAGAQIIVETHSDHIINGIRVATKKNMIDADKIKLYYFDRNINEEEHYSFVREPKIDQDGRIDYWPEGFMDEWDKNLMELL